MEATSIKQLIQSLIPDGPSVVEGTVTSVSPLTITLVNDSKMVLTASSLVVPEHLTNHKVTVDLSKSTGTLSSITTTEEEHDHSLSTFSLTSGTLCIYNGLKKGESVLLLAYDNGKRYLVIDRKG